MRKKMTNRQLMQLKSKVLDVLVCSILVHDAKDGFKRAEHWPAFSVAIKHLKGALR